VLCALVSAASNKIINGDMIAEANLFSCVTRIEDIRIRTEEVGTAEK